MLHRLAVFSLAMLTTWLLVPGISVASDVAGQYLEVRSCDVYTGPCFANAEVGATGRDAILAWQIEQGSHNGVEIAGLSVVMVVRAADTLGFGGGLVIHPDPIKSVVLVDERADFEQREALVEFATEKAGRVAGEVVRIESVPIALRVDHESMVGSLNAGEIAEIETRQLTHHDHLCSNEVIYYPPLSEVDDYKPAVTVSGRYRGRGLGTRWSIPGTRGAFLASFGG